MPTPSHDPAAPDRTTARQRLIIGALAAALALLVGLGASEARLGEPGDYPRYAAGDNRLYRIYEDGRIDYLIVDFANGSVEGIPGWAPLHIDHSLSRDRMGNETRAGRH